MRGGCSALDIKGRLHLLSSEQQGHGRGRLKNAIGRKGGVRRINQDPFWPSWPGPRGRWGRCCRDGCLRNAQGRRRRPQPHPAPPYSSPSCRGWVRAVCNFTSGGGWVGGCVALPHAHIIMQIPVKVELYFALPAAVKALCSEDGVVQVQRGWGGERPPGGRAAGELGADTDTLSTLPSGLGTAGLWVRGYMGASASPKISWGACPLLPAARRDPEDTAEPRQTPGARLL